MHRAILNDSAEDLVAWLKHIPALTTYVSVMREKGVTGAQMLEIDSDQPLIDLGIESDIDRSDTTSLHIVPLLLSFFLLLEPAHLMNLLGPKYLLLQIARARQRTRATRRVRRGSITVNAAQAFMAAGASVKKPASLLEAAGASAGVVHEPDASTLATASRPGAPAAAFSAGHKLSLRRHKPDRTSSLSGTELQPCTSP